MRFARAEDYFAHADWAEDFEDQDSAEDYNCEIGVQLRIAAD